MKNQVAAVAVIIALIVGASVGYSGIAGNASTKTETLTTTFVKTVTVSQNVSVPCQVGPWSPESNSTVLTNGTVTTRVSWPVFLMKPGSQATVCVAYHNPYNQTLPASIFAVVLSWGPNVTERLPSQVKVNASQTDLALSLGRIATVFFQLNVPLNATGFYGLYLFQQCDLIPIAVGYQASQVNLNDFPGLFGESTCQAIFLDSQITGFNGGTLAYYACTLTPLPKSGPAIQYCK